MTNNPVQVLKSVVLLLSSTVGRDKVCRLLQYGGRFLSVVVRQQIEKGTLPKETFDLIAGRIERLSANMSLTRKVLRFGRPIGLALAFLDFGKQLNSVLSGEQKSTDIKQHPVYLACKMGSQLGLIGFFTLDHVSYLSRVDLMEKRPQLVSNCEFYSFLSWFFDCIFGIISNSMEIKYLFNRIQAEQLSSEEGKNEKIKALQDRLDGSIVDILRNIVDVPVAIGLMYPKIVTPAVTGLCGAITSYIGAYQAWK